MLGYEPTGRGFGDGLDFIAQLLDPTFWPAKTALRFDLSASEADAAIGRLILTGFRNLSDPFTAAVVGTRNELPVCSSPLVT